MSTNLAWKAIDKVVKVGYTDNTNEEIGDVSRVTW
jgi:hypothetical protein